LFLLELLHFINGRYMIDSTLDLRPGLKAHDPSAVDLLELKYCPEESIIIYYLMSTDMRTRSSHDKIWLYTKWMSFIHSSTKHSSKLGHRSIDIYSNLKVCCH
jgi:hypothetical protein